MRRTTKRKKTISPERQAREMATAMKTRKISPERQAREVARLADKIARHESRILQLSASLAGLRVRLRFVKRGVVPA